MAKVTNLERIQSDNSDQKIKYNNKNIQNGLLASTNRVEAPFIRVTINGYTFGLYEEKSGLTGARGLYEGIMSKYPNYVQSLEVEKINGTVNIYTLVIKYPVTQDDDPNFFEKLFGSISTSWLIKLDYGDATLPNYIYRSEEAIITDLQSTLDVKSSVITYTLKAQSTSMLTLSGCHNFATTYAKPSDLIKSILKQDNTYHLLDVFTGMKNQDLDLLIAGNDKPATIPTYIGISALEYISKLVSCMIPAGTPDNSVKSNSVFTLTTYEDTTGVYGGPYFKVSEIIGNTATLNQLTTYKVDIGYPTSNLVTSFDIKDTNSWSLYYTYNNEVNSNDYVKRIDKNGNIVDEYSPFLAGTKYNLYATDKTWWTKVTEFPIQAEMTIKGLLKPAILMTYLKVNVWFYGRKHNSSGYYIITSQKDKIDDNGYFTTLGLLRIAADDDL